MKIDILVPIGKRGGAENTINAVSLYLKEKGHDIRIVQIIWCGEKWVPEEIPFRVLLKVKKAAYTYEDFVELYSQFVRESGAPEVVLATAWPNMCYVARKAERVTGLKFKVIYWPHSPINEYEKMRFGGYQVLEHADASLAISDMIYRGIKLHWPEKTVFMVHNPVAEKHFLRELSCDSVEKDLSEKQICDRKKQLFFVGRISGEKHLEVMIRAIADVKENWELHIVGAGKESYQNELYIIVKALKIEENIIWHGWVENPWQHTKEADAVVLASEYEGFPLVAIEALANGIPVISTPVSGIVELIKPGINGYLYPLGDSNGLVEILQAITRGVLPIIDPKVCRETVENFREGLALRDFERKILECTECETMQNVTKSTHAFLNYREKISIIVPCHNEGKYLEECLDSIFNQTYPLERMEVVIVNSASDDDSCMIMQKHEERYPEQIMLINLEQNPGVEKSCDIGLQYVSGEYVIFADPKEKMHKEIVESLYAKCKLYGNNYSECGYTMYIRS